jgi:hypothetical protein
MKDRTSFVNSFNLFNSNAAITQHCKIKRRKHLSRDQIQPMTLTFVHPHLLFFDSVKTVDKDNNTKIGPSIASSRSSKSNRRRADLFNTHKYS